MTADPVPFHLWHAETPEGALAALECAATGLSGSEVATRRARFGPNVLPKAPPTPLWRIYLRQFENPLIYLLLAAAAVSVVIGEWVDALFIFLILQFNAVIGVVQERKAADTAGALDAMIRVWTTVRRDGRTERIDGVDLVPGDVVLLESGMQAPADARLLREQELRVDESLLTGESAPVEKDAGAVLAPETGVADRVNMLFAGTTVVNGRAEAVIAQTGVHTEVGRIAQALAGVAMPSAPIIVRLEKFTRAIGIVIVAAIALLAVFQFQQGLELRQIFFAAVALAVSAIPEGLPVAITIALSGASRRMAARNVIARSLPAVEGLGECTAIASDKTGTLTVNEMTVKRLVLPDGREIAVGGEGYVPEGGFSVEGGAPDEATDAAVRRLARAGALCNEAAFRREADGTHRFGDTVDVAFLVLAAKTGLWRESLIAAAPETRFIPFEPARRFAASFNRAADGTVALSVKGAAEAVIPMCRSIADGGIDHALALARADALAQRGFRVLAVAGREGLAAGAGEESLGALDFLGFVGLIDPLRPEAAEAVRRCRGAGIEVLMVTGDHPATALAIARDLGIATRREDVVTGAEIKDMADDPAALAEAVGRARVFARVEPVQKLTIVRALQDRGHFVAVTGDGVNDAPALHAAHIGVAMGRDGTDVARAAADLIVADDNFASIVNGVEEGRVAYDNVRKVIYLLVSCGLAEIVVFAVSLWWGLPLPLFATQLLWLNLVTDGIHPVALALEKGDPDILKRPPRPPEQPIFDRRMLEQSFISGLLMGVLAAYAFRVMLESGMNEASARNMVFLLLVLFENVHFHNCSSETRSIFHRSNWRNRLTVLAPPLALTVHIAATWTPGLREVLHAEPVTAEMVLTLLPVALVAVVVMEAYKWWVRRRAA